MIWSHQFSIFWRLRIRRDFVNKKGHIEQINKWGSDKRGWGGGVDDEGYIGEERESRGDASRRFVWHCLQLKLLKRDVILMNAILMTCCRMTYCKVAFCDSAIPRRRRRRDRGPNVMHLLYHWCFVRTNTLNGNTILIWMSWQEPFSKTF